MAGWIVEDAFGLHVYVLSKIFTLKHIISQIFKVVLGHWTSFDILLGPLDKLNDILQDKLGVNSIKSCLILAKSITFI